MSRPVTLPFRVSTDDIGEMRHWLRQRVGKAPRKPEAVLWEYVTHNLLNDAERDTVSLCVEPEASS